MCNIISTIFLDKNYFNYLSNEWELLVDSDPTDTNNNKILVLCEPKCIYKRYYTMVKYHYQKFKYILTFDETLLKYPNTYKCIFGTTRTKDNTDISNKTFKISMLLTDKRITNEQIARYIIFNNKLKYNIPTLFLINNKVDIKYLTKDIKKYYTYDRNRILNLDDKSELFNECQYHICIENCKISNYFTEKIIDCFVTMTIPIYYGCVNIDTYFDTSSIIILENLDISYVIDKINSIPSTFYMDNLESIKKNYILAQQYKDFSKNIDKSLKSIPELLSLYNKHNS